MKRKRVLAVSLASFCFSIPVMAGSHSWRFSELFSNASGTVQFIELKCDPSGENGVGSLLITVVVGGSTVNTFTFPPGPLPGSTLNKKLLLATNGFTALPGAPARDFALPNGFLPLTGTFTLRYHPGGNYDTNIVPAGAIPTNGINSLQYTTFLQAGVDTFTNNTANNPTNYTTGIPGFVDASCIDNDGDGYGNPGDASCTNGSATDCNDNNANVHPNALEQESANNCVDGLDNDCDTIVDCAEAGCAIAACGVPTVSEWGVLIMALLTLSAGSVMLRQRA